MNKRIIPEMWKPIYDTNHFAPGVIDGPILRCSGSVGIDFSNFSIPDDPKTQFTFAFENLLPTLQEVGATFADVTEMTTYHVDMATHMEVFAAVKDQFIVEPYPAWSAIGISELAGGALVEIRINVRIP